MSELISCNFCTLNWLRNAYGKEVTLKPNKKNGGVDYFIHKKGKRPSKKHSGWFAKLTDHCVC